MDARGLLHKIEGDGAIAGHLDIGDGLRHQLQTIGIGCEECRSRIGVVGKTRVNHQCLRIGVRICRCAQILIVQMSLISPLTIIFTIVCRIPGTIVLTIGMEKTVTIMGVGNVQIIILPFDIIVIHMEDQQAITRTADIPPLLLTIL